MSTKSKTRASSQAQSSSMATPQVPTSSTSSVTSPMTPTRMSRIQEKNQLANLNDRLAAYIERNQQLEQENQVYSKQITKYEESTNKTVTRIKGDYDREIMGLRKTVDDTAKDKSKLENDYGSLKRDFDDVKSKLDKKSKEFQASQKNLTQMENANADLQANFSRTTAERDKLLAERKELEGEVARLGKEVGDVRNKLEHETAARVEAENQLRTKTEELRFSQSLHHQELTEMKQRRQVEIQEVDGRLQQEYEVKLQQSIQELRAEYEEQLRGNKEEMENLYDQKYNDMKNQLKRTQASLASKSEEMITLQTKLDMSVQNSSKFEQERADLVKRVKDLEKKSDEDHSKFAKMLDVRDSEIDALVKEKSCLMNEYRDLMDVKVALDNEISTYRKLLEYEEKRLKLSPGEIRRGGTPSVPDRRATPLRGVKRRYEGESFDEFDYVSDSKKRGDIEIEEDDAEGKYIKLMNKGEKDVSLSGWVLTRNVGSEETTHKFHRQVKLAPNTVVTVWSADAVNAVHEPPHSITMKQKWFPGEEIVTTLVNNSGEEMATRVTKRAQVSRQRKRLGFGPGTGEDLFHQAGEGEAAGDRCTIC